MRSWKIVLLSVALAGCLSDVPTAPDEAPPNGEPLAGCAISCHGADTSNAPPKSISGATDTASTAVGAHQQHLGAAPSWHHKVDCTDCHVVRAAVDSPGHIDGDNKAELTFSMHAGSSMWNGTTCTLVTQAIILVSIV